MEAKNKWVVKLLEIVQEHKEYIQELRDEIARLKNLKAKPKIKPGTLEGREQNAGKKRRGWKKRAKKATLEIHETKVVTPKRVPANAVFKGYRDLIVQDIRIAPFNTCYRIARYQLSDGSYLEGDPPTREHFGSKLRSFILYQYYQCHVTQPLLLEQLEEFGIEISAGQINRILTEGKEAFHREKEEILKAGLEVSSYIQVDDTGARHDGKNGYCTNISNEFFAWFKSTDSKSRLNFLTLLVPKPIDYRIRFEMIQYLNEEEFSEIRLHGLRTQVGMVFGSKDAWEHYLERLGFTKVQKQIATEALLMGILLSSHIHSDLAILSDDAGQFNILRHALCWVHAERGFSKLIPQCDRDRFELEAARARLWEYYTDLKAYKQNPTAERKLDLEQRFEAIFGQETSYAALNRSLAQIQKNKQELLLVLERPEIPLHNNTCESDIREYVKRRKVSGSTRSLLGRESRDTFTSLKKTCRKLGVSFWAYLADRVSGSLSIPYLPDLILQRATPPP